MAVDSAPVVGPSGIIDVEAVAAKHGWDLQQRNDYSADKQVRMIPVGSIRRPLQGARSNGERMAAGAGWLAAGYRVPHLCYTLRFATAVHAATPA